MTLEISTVAQVQNLLATGLFSGRKIALLTGISRGTVATIRRGDWRPRQARQPEPPPGPVAKCTTCGRMIEQPCRACRDERLLKEGEGTLRRLSSRLREAEIDPVGIELRPEHRVRYEQIRARKLEQLRLFAS